MNVREEDSRKNNCPSRGLGLAAAAIGVGVGAALYYFFSKRPENPDSEGSTSGNWSCEEPQTFTITSSSDKSDYITVSEHTTTDTSIYLTDQESEPSRLRITIQRKINFDSEDSSKMDSSFEYYDEGSYDDYDSESSHYEDDVQESCHDDDYDEDSCHYEDSDNNEESGHDDNNDEATDHDVDNSGESVLDEESSHDVESSHEEYVPDSEQESDDEHSDIDTDMPTGESSDDSTEEDYADISDTITDLIYDSSVETGYVTLRTTSRSVNETNETSDSEIDMEWDITNSSVDVPTDTNASLSPFFRNLISVLTSPRLQNKPSAEDEQTRILREQAFRERRWSLEECSICFDVMLKDQQLLQLPCTHNFHVACIGPWLQEHQTCPMCRKAAE